LETTPSSCQSLQVKRQRRSCDVSHSDQGQTGTIDLTTPSSPADDKSISAASASAEEEAQQLSAQRQVEASNNEEEEHFVASTKLESTAQLHYKHTYKLKFRLKSSY
jgi:hypothetical protein